MPLFVYTTARKRFVIFTRRYFKLSWNTTALSQSNCRNFSCSSITPRNRELKQRERQKRKRFTGFYLGFIVWGVVPSRLVFTSSTKREIRHYHVGVQWRQRNGPKMHDARAKLLFFHSRGQHLCKCIGTKESVCIRKEFSYHRIGLGHQHGCRFIVLGHQYGVTSCENTLLILCPSRWRRRRR